MTASEEKSCEFSVTEALESLEKDFEELRISDCKDAKEFVPTTLAMKLHSIYDGDTARMTGKYGGGIYLFNCRMNGYDSPEMKPKKDVSGRDEIKKKAVEAKEYLRGLFKQNDDLVICSCDGYDKYGRLLVTVYGYKDGVNFNQAMIKNGHGYEYHGGTKEK